MNHENHLRRDSRDNNNGQSYTTYDECDLLLPHHLPEVRARVWQWPLSRYVPVDDSAARNLHVNVVSVDVVAGRKVT